MQYMCSIISNVQLAFELVQVDPRTTTGMFKRGVSKTPRNQFSYCLRINPLTGSTSNPCNSCPKLCSEQLLRGSIVTDDLEEPQFQVATVQNWQ
jgi:hypothetical protein